VTATGERVVIGPDRPMRRVVDVVAAAGSLVVLSPVLGVVAVLVRRDSPGPALFRQKRIGRGEVPFEILKFRTMVDGADRLGPAVSGNTDARVTRLGALLRRTKLDELPQLVNVLRGEMTLIGPRAEVGRYVVHYTPLERQTLTVRPGLTGPGGIWFTASQAGDLDESDDPEAEYVDRQLHEKLALDLAYLQRRTLAADLRLVGQTLALLWRD
jgi:lipopolysaccharide/colanic/teichoic acid biosynthesis glycosyltransferase